MCHHVRQVYSNVMMNHVYHISLCVMAMMTVLTQEEMKRTVLKLQVCYVLSHFHGYSGNDKNCCVTQLKYKMTLCTSLCRSTGASLELFYLGGVRVSICRQRPFIFFLYKFCQKVDPLGICAAKSDKQQKKK